MWRWGERTELGAVRSGRPIGRSAGPEAAKPRRCLRQKQPRRSRGSRPNFQANRVRRRKFGKRQPGGGRGFRFPLPTLTTSPLALSRFLRRATAGACKNRSTAPAAAPCFVHWTRSPPLPWTQKRKSQRSKAGKNNSSWPVETFRASNGERVFSDRPLPAAPILSSNPTRRPIVEPLRPGALNLKLVQTQNPRSKAMERGFVLILDFTSGKIRQKTGYL